MLVVGLVYLFVKFSDFFFPLLANPGKDGWRFGVPGARGAKLKEENERLKAHIQRLIESGKQDQERIRASFPKPKGEFDTEDDG